MSQSQQHGCLPYIPLVTLRQDCRTLVQHTRDAQKEHHLSVWSLQTVLSRPKFLAAGLNAGV